MNLIKATIAPGLHLVATPIGAARDITLRALDLLAGADMLAAEDTRTTRKLMEIHGISLGGRPLISVHDHSGPGAISRVTEALRAGRSVAYVSEAGTPVLADPGFELARAAIAENLPVMAAPGASALLCALAVAGVPAERFLFMGFLPTTQAARMAELAELAHAPWPVIIYESPKRVRETLADMVVCLGRERPVALCRELTKRFEEVRRGSLGQLLDEFPQDGLRGEFVIVVGRAAAKAADPADLRDALRKALVTMRVKDAAAAVAGAMGLPRREVYQAALDLMSETDGPEPSGADPRD